jgi:hypothetical protein
VAGKKEYVLVGNNLKGHSVCFYEVAPANEAADDTLFRGEHFSINDDLQRICIKFRKKGDSADCIDAVITVELMDTST